MAPRGKPASAAISSMDAPVTPFLANTSAAASTSASRVICRRRSGVSFSTGMPRIMTEFTLDSKRQDRIINTDMYVSCATVQEGRGEQAEEVQRWVQRRLGFEAWLRGLHTRRSDTPPTSRRSDPPPSARDGDHAGAPEVRAVAV